jgi:hypothetical protein
MGDLALIWIGSAVVGAIIGSAKNAWIRGALLGIILGPLGVMIMLGIAPFLLVCHGCKHSISKSNLNCPNCGRPTNL